MTIVGSWDLMHWRRLGSNDEVIYPLGQSARGLLVYTGSHHVIVQMVADGRSTFSVTDPLGGTVEERAAAYSGFLGYFGTYDVDDRDVTHHIEGCSYPNWSNTVAVRPYELHHDQLILRTSPSVSEGVTWVNEMAWRRAPSD